MSTQTGDPYLSYDYTPSNTEFRSYRELLNKGYAVVYAGVTQGGFKSILLIKRVGNYFIGWHAYRGHPIEMDPSTYRWSKMDRNRRIYSRKNTEELTIRWPTLVAILKEERLLQDDWSEEFAVELTAAIDHIAGLVDTSPPKITAARALSVMQHNSYFLRCFRGVLGMSVQVRPDGNHFILVTVSSQPEANLPTELGDVDVEYTSVEVDLT